MTETSAQARDTEPSSPAQAADPAGSEPVAEPSAPDSAAAAAREAADLKDRLLRALAEMENQRRRSERDVADARAYAISAFARDLLAVADNMRRALDAVGADAREDADPRLRALIEGVELTERELINTLERNGVKKIDAEGARFDPHRHQAMFEVPDAAVPVGTVVQVVQPGYTIGDRVLRPAMVAVSKGGPKPASADAGQEVSSANDNQSSASQ
jgi:molecular chaperone GrpE